MQDLARLLSGVYQWNRNGQILNQTDYGAGYLAG